MAGWIAKIIPLNKGYSLKTKPDAWKMFAGTLRTFESGTSVVITAVYLEFIISKLV